MKVLVTGAAGFVGSRVCRRIEQSGHEVVAVSNLNNEHDGYAIDVADASTFSSIEDVQDIDALVHCAGIAHRFGDTSPQEYSSVNVTGSKNVAEFAARKGIRKMVLLSSVLVYGPSISPEPILEDHDLRPSDAYALSKLEGERMASEVCGKADVDLVILRPAPIIGEGSRGNVHRLIEAIDQGRFVWIGDGSNKRSFVYVEDVARAIETGLQIGSKLEVFNVVGGCLTVREMVDSIAIALGKKVPRMSVPGSIARGMVSATAFAGESTLIGRYRRTLETWLADAVYSGEHLRSEGFEAFTPIPKALELEVAHYLDNR